MTLPRWLGAGSVAFLVLWLLLLAAGRSNFLRDPGTFWHVTTGELILADGFIRADPYTFTFGGTWWVPYQWLGEVGMALAHRVGGFDTLLLGTVTLLAAVFAWLFTRLLRTGIHPVGAGMVVMLALAASSSHFHVRPHIFTIAAMAVTTATLVAIDAGRIPVRRLAWLLPLFVVWTNVHGGVLAGMVTVGITALGWVIALRLGFPSPMRSWKDAVTVLTIATGCGLTAFVNPYGFDLIRTWYVIMGEPALKQIVQEHSPLDPTEPYAWAVMAFGGLYLFVLAGVRVRELRVTWLLSLVWLVMAFDRVRHAPLFAVVGLVAIAAVWPHTRWAARLKQTRPDLYTPPDHEPRTPVWVNLWLPALAVGIAFTLQVCHVPAPLIGSGWARHDPTHWPVALVDVLKEHEPDSPGDLYRIFNGYIDGGFIEYHAPGYKVFVDDRCEVFGGDWLVAFVRADAVGTAGAMAAWEHDYGRFAFALTRPGTGYDRYFSGSEEWEPVKRTPTANFYTRRR